MIDAKRQLAIKYTVAARLVKAEKAEPTTLREMTIADTDRKRATQAKR